MFRENTRRQYWMEFQIDLHSYANYAPQCQTVKLEWNKSALSDLWKSREKFGTIKGHRAAERKLMIIINVYPLSDMSHQLLLTHLNKNSLIIIFGTYWIIGITIVFLYTAYIYIYIYI